MTVIQAAAALTLWRSGQFDTRDIAVVLGGTVQDVSEANVCRVLHAAKERERGADLHVVAS